MLILQGTTVVAPEWVFEFMNYLAFVLLFTFTTQGYSQGSNTAPGLERNIVYYEHIELDGSVVRIVGDLPNVNLEFTNNAETASLLTNIELIVGGDTIRCGGRKYNREFQYFLLPGEKFVKSVVLEDADWTKWKTPVLRIGRYLVGTETIGIENYMHCF